MCALARALPRCTSLSELDLRGNHIDMAASKGARTLATYVGDSVSLRQLDGLDLRGHSAQVERGEQLSTCVIWLRRAPTGLRAVPDAPISAKQRRAEDLR